MPRATISPAYREDVDNLCNAVERSGAAAKGDHDRVVMSAQWLGGAIATEEGRSFLVAWNQLPTAARSTALRTEAARAGLIGCPLADDWAAREKK